MSEFPQAQGPRTLDIDFEPTDTPKTRRPWTDMEDQTLRHLVSQLGSARGRQGRWTDIARGLPDRTAKVRMIRDLLLPFSLQSSRPLSHFHLT
jgi:hypothetical protein